MSLLPVEGGKGLNERFSSVFSCKRKFDCLSCSARRWMTKSRCPFLEWVVEDVRVVVAAKRDGVSA